ncbi:DUF5666 domain-containing protein [Paenibacillus sp. JDR-2]|uniref:DUF5666 domain-containing protein n=1 Tax=Paenibacillus sp. (strain JDR-2) TaxID=324057 RepID=UPI000166AE93|nr:DUF5666 domain-containing protein [Paenibacillus sp. JDR-2]ACT04777.1 hypothetical protein Pjdr2_6174 [Paenibacillus sp. JDR-2]
MKKSVYKSAMSQLRTSDDFKEATYQKLMLELEKTSHNPTNQKEPIKMEKSKKKLTGWTVGIAAAAILAVGVISVNQNQNNPASTPTNQEQTAEATSKPPIMGKVAVNIDGVISEVSTDGKSFKVGDLWVEVTDKTQLGSSEPTAAAPSQELLNKDFKAGDIVSGYTSQDVSTGKVTADVIYNLIAPEKEEAGKPATTGKMAVNIDGFISEVSADGKSFKVNDVWVTVTPDTIMGITEPTAGEQSDELLQKEFKVGNAVSGFTTEDLSSGKVNATRIYNNFAPQK